MAVENEFNNIPVLASIAEPESLNSFPAGPQPAPILKQQPKNDRLLLKRDNAHSFETDHSLKERLEGVHDRLVSGLEIQGNALMCGDSSRG